MLNVLVLFQKSGNVKQLPELHTLGNETGHCFPWTHLIRGIAWQQWLHLLYAVTHVVSKKAHKKLKGRFLLLLCSGHGEHELCGTNTRGSRVLTADNLADRLVGYKGNGKRHIFDDYDAIVIALLLFIYIIYINK